MKKTNKILQNVDIKDKSHWQKNKEFIQLISENSQFNTLRWGICFSIIITYFISQYTDLKTVFDANSYQFFWFFAIGGIILEILLRTGIFKVYQSFVNIEKLSFAKKSVYLFLENLKFTWLFWFALAFIRTFIIDYYHIPTQSMLPNYEIGTKTVVLKPISKLFVNNDIESGNVILFNFLPEHGGSDIYIKRVIAKGGDRIEVKPNTLKVYRNNQVIVDTQFNVEKETTNYEYHKASQMFVFMPKQVGSLIKATKFKETIGNHQYDVIYDKVGLDDMVSNTGSMQENNHLSSAFPSILFPKEMEKHCLDFKTASNELYCIVPENQYFVMGDNRTGSFDGRYWGFVKQEHIIDKLRYSF